MTEPANARRPPRNCRVCAHPSVLAINAALLNGKPYRAIARDFKIGNEKNGEFIPDHKPVSRHAERCVPAAIESRQPTPLTKQGAAIQARLMELDAHVDTAIQDALLGNIIMHGDTPMLDNETGEPVRERSIQHIRALLAAVREGRHNQALIARLAGALPEENADDAEASREMLKDPAVRKLVQQMEERLADLQKESGQDAVT